MDDRRLAEQLHAAGLVTDEQYRAAHLASPEDLAFGLLSTGAISETDLLKFLGLQFQTRYVSTEKLGSATVPQWVLDLLPAELCEQLHVLPVRCDKERLVLSIVTPDPGDPRVLEAVRRASMAQEVRAHVALRHAIEAAIRRFYKGDIHAFARMEQALGAHYGQLLNIYDQRVIDLGSGAGAPADLDRLPTGEVSAVGAPPAPTDATASPNDKDASRSKRPSSAVAGTLVPPADGMGVLDQLAGPDATPLGERQLALDDDERLRPEAFVRTVAVLVNVLEMGHGWRQGHSAEVARLVQLLAERTTLPKEQFFSLQLAAYLHDVGRPTDPHLSALSTASAAPSAEPAPRAGVDPLKLLEGIHLPATTTSILVAQHERPDGRGIPGKLAGRGIPLGARLLAVSNAYCDLLANPRAPGGRVTDPLQALARLRDAAERRVLDQYAVDRLAEVLTGDAAEGVAVGQRPRVLVVDRDMESTALLELKLVGAGHDVRVVQTTAEAAREILASPIDLILSEVRLDPVDGFDFLKRMQADARTRQIPLIFVSECADAEDVNRGFELGALDYIVKPYAPELVVAKVKNIVAQRPGARRAQQG
ncbi:MAG: response regulator [Deltaproteobacteria bacterium]|nr:response regulator [Deltaproteobacteria bacterium]